jgi:hypothetical protein
MYNILSFTDVLDWIETLALEQPHFYQYPYSINILFKPRFLNIDILPLSVREIAIERINAWHKLGHRIFITTARTKEDLPKLKAWAKKHKLKYTDIILNCGRGPRYLINDIDPTLKLDKAVAYCLTRNSGLEKIEALSGSSIKSENGKESKV